MNEPDLKNLLNCIDAAFLVFVRNEGKLTSAEISLKSMLSVLRRQVAEELASVKELDS